MAILSVHIQSGEQGHMNRTSQGSCQNEEMLKGSMSPRPCEMDECNCKYHLRQWSDGDISDLDVSLISESEPLNIQEIDGGKRKSAIFDSTCKSYCIKCGEGMWVRQSSKRMYFKRAQLHVCRECDANVVNQVKMHNEPEEEGYTTDASTRRVFTKNLNTNFHQGADSCSSGEKSFHMKSVKEAAEISEIMGTWQEFLHPYLDFINGGVLVNQKTPGYKLNTPIRPRGSSQGCWRERRGLRPSARPPQEVPPPPSPPPHERLAETRQARSSSQRKVCKI